ncbi:hypothetical protein [Brevundimonas sp. GCM10030266]|uniref:hypothetical protein n=1 Tax=Brevundimonas sp. GCM10030266 TaxID=3273386 RepID=UPI0036161AA2
MRLLIEIVVLLIAAAVGATVSLLMLALVLLSLPGAAGVARPVDGALVWTAFVVAGTAFWPFVAATGAARLIAGALDHADDWKRVGFYAAGLMAGVMVLLALIEPTAGSGFGLLFLFVSIIGAGVAGSAATLLVNRATGQTAR